MSDKKEIFNDAQKDLAHGLAGHIVSKFSDKMKEALSIAMFVEKHIDPGSKVIGDRVRVLNPNALFTEDLELLENYIEDNLKVSDIYVVAEVCDPVKEVKGQLDLPCNLKYLIYNTVNKKKYYCEEITIYRYNEETK